MFSFTASRQPTPEIRGDGLVIRTPQLNDYTAWRDLRLRSRDFLMPYEPRWSEADLSMRNYTARIKRNRSDSIAGREYSLFIFHQQGLRLTLVGGMTLSNVRRRAFQNVTLGYWMGEQYAGKGIMTRAVALILPFVFDTLGLHRIDAACLLNNAASRRVLINNGFREIGIAEHYLQINGAWQDHRLFALTSEQYDDLAG